ncbi:MAG TPA: helix-turn-helix domain-containing protein [Candidatus Dormibacteraeota bacterium]
MPRRRRVDAQRNRRAILKAAEIVFRTQGADAPIDEIARRAGVGVGTVYRNYPTKAAVIQAIIEARIAPIIIAARKARAAEDSGEAFFALLRRLVEESSVFKPLMDSIVAAGVDVHAAKTELLNELVTAMGELLAGAQRSGWVRHDVSIDDVTMLMAGLSHTSLAASDKPARSRCVNLVCDALRGDKSTARAAGRAHPRSL